MDQHQQIVPLGERKDERVLPPPPEWLMDMAEKRPGGFLLAAAAVGIGTLGLIGYSIYKGRKLKIDFKGFDVTVE